jgi:hypothetical protein
MESLIGYRFLKQFLGNRLHGRSAIPASEIGDPAEDPVEKPAEPSDQPKEDSLDKQTPQDRSHTGEPTNLPNNQA